jgi:hypothetical protein
VILDVVAGPSAPSQFVIERHDTFVLGRAADCHLRIENDPRVSRHHFLLEALPPRARIRDLGSRNGTWVNGLRYGGRGAGEQAASGDGHGPEVELKHDDQVKVGRTIIRILVDPPQDQPPVAEPAVAPIEQPAEQPKCLVDRLELFEELGQTALATVCRAVDSLTGQVVALKRVRLDREFNAGKRRRLLEEIDQLQDLRHPHLTALLESGIKDSALYYIREYCEVGDVAQFARQHGGKLILGQVRPLMFQALDGLECAHARGSIHGHLKPSNILLQRQEGKLLAKISDFGLARVLDQAGCAGMTATGEIRLDYQFTPPERLTGFRECRVESDLWSLGAVFYHLLTGQYPNDLSGRDPLAAILHPEIVPLRDRDRSIPESLAKVIDRALAVEANSRFHSAAEMRAHLTRAFDAMRAG